MSDIPFYTNSEDEEYDSQGRDESSITDELLNIIETSFMQEKFDVASLCEAVSLSRQHVYRVIKEATGESPSMYIRSKRLQYAQSFLSEDLSIAEVAYKSGFSDPNYFTRVFKEVYGCTPTAWRENG